jgi:hypothetical protein
VNGIRASDSAGRRDENVPTRVSVVSTSIEIQGRPPAYEHVAKCLLGMSESAVNMFYPDLVNTC